jgi:hypothetical protein
MGKIEVCEICRGTYCDGKTYIVTVPLGPGARGGSFKVCTSQLVVHNGKNQYLHVVGFGEEEWVDVVPEREVIE